MSVVSHTLRDAFWGRVYQQAKNNPDIVVISCDMGAPALDIFRRELSGQFVNAGIAEQNGMLIAAGLAKEGKHPFVYAIAPFVAIRCLEQTRVNSAIMGLPVTLVGVGVGFGYDDSGPTHHLIEDIAMLRSMPKVCLHTVSDDIMAEEIASQSVSMACTNYVRLDRKPLDRIYAKDQDFSTGFTVSGDGADLCIVSCGFMVHQARNVAEKLSAKGVKVAVVDLFQLPCDEKALAGVLSASAKVVTVEEHFLPGGLGSYVLEIMNDHDVSVPVRRIGLQHRDGYCYTYGGREEIHRYYGVSLKEIQASIEKFASRS